MDSSNAILASPPRTFQREAKKIPSMPKHDRKNKIFLKNVFSQNVPSDT